MLVSKHFTNGPAGTLYAAQESEEVPVVDGLIVPEGHVTAVGADGRGRIRHQRRHFTHVGRIHLVVIRTNGERLHLNFMQAIPSLPVFEIARHLELALTLHLVVNLLVAEAERTGHRLGPGLQTTDHLRRQSLHDTACICRIFVLLRSVHRMCNWSLPKR